MLQDHHRQQQLKKYFLFLFLIMSEILKTFNRVLDIIEKTELGEPITENDDNSEPRSARSTDDETRDDSETDSENEQPPQNFNHIKQKILRKYRRKYALKSILTELYPNNTRREAAKMLINNFNKFRRVVDTAERYRFDEGTKKEIKIFIYYVVSFHSLTYNGKKYTKAALFADLKKIYYNTLKNSELKSEICKEDFICYYNQEAPILCLTEDQFNELKEIFKQVQQIAEFK